MQNPDLETRVTTFGYRRPSQQLRIAMRDMRKVEKSPTFYIEMGDWLTPNPLWCGACMAGSVLVMSLGAETDRVMDEQMEEWPTPELPRWASALDDVRRGRWQDALQAWDIRDEIRDLPSVPSYDRDPQGFYDAIETAADILEKAGH